MKKRNLWLISFMLIAGCSSSSTELALDAKHTPLPDYVMKSPPKVQETYKMAANYPQVLASVPCYCGCYAEDNHTSNLDCFVDQMGTNNEVLAWDPMSVT